MLPFLGWSGLEGEGGRRAGENWQVQRSGHVGGRRALAAGGGRGGSRQVNDGRPAGLLSAGRHSGVPPAGGARGLDGVSTLEPGRLGGREAGPAGSRCAPPAVYCCVPERAIISASHPRLLSFLLVLAALPARARPPCWTCSAGARPWAGSRARYSTRVRDRAGLGWAGLGWLGWGCWGPLGQAGLSGLGWAGGRQGL